MNASRESHATVHELTSQIQELQVRLNQDTFSDRDAFSLRHQQVFGSKELFIRFSNPANVAQSLLDGNRDHLLAEARSELMKHTKWNLLTRVFMNFSSKLMLSDWNCRTPITDILNLEENKYDNKKN